MNILFYMYFMLLFRVVVSDSSGPDAALRSVGSDIWTPGRRAGGGRLPWIRVAEMSPSTGRS